jgi:NAD(P)-dependent dehydrogenase (short-subunit alcohol dehydrogenase family)
MGAPKNKLVVVTGATRGLGRAMVDGFIARGHTVCGCGRSAEQIEALAETHGPPHDFAVVDVASDDDVGRWAARVLREKGAPDLLVNNAALMNQPARLWEVPKEEFSQMLDVNLGGIANVIRHVLPAMIERGHGVVVNFSSGWGRATAPEVAPYCTTKWGVEGLTRALAQELPRNMAAVAVNPGIIDTEMLRTCWGDHAGAYTDPGTWASAAVPFLLALGPADNGRSRDVPI